MPYVLTEEEKQTIREQYLDNIQRINEYMPDNLKISTNLSDLNKRLNDPKEQRLYKKGLELHAREERRKALYNRLEDKYDYLRSKDKTYVLDRVLYYQFNMSDDPFAEEYNENVVANYYLHPEAMVQQEMTKVLNFDPSVMAEISKSDDMDNLLLDFYESNAQVCEYAFALKGSLKNMPDGVVNEETLKYVDSFASCYEMLEIASEGVKNITADSFFVIPDLTPEQMSYVEGTSLEEDDGELYKSIKTHSKYRNFRVNSDPQFKNFFKKAQKKGYAPYGKGAFNKMIAKQVNPDGSKKVIPFANVFDGQYDDVKVEFSTLDDEQAKELFPIFNKDFVKSEKFVQNDFVPSVPPTIDDKMKALRFQYAATTGLALHSVENMDLRDMIARHKGGFFERTFDTTSQEFKDLTSTINAYYDSTSPNYGSDTAVIDSADAYLKHKGVTCVADALRLDETGKGRALLCLAITGKLPDAERNMKFRYDYVSIPPKPLEQDPQVVNGEIIKPKKEPAIIDKSEVEIHPPKIDVVVKEAEPDNNLVLTKNDLKM